MRQWLKNAGKFPLLAPEQEIELGRQIQAVEAFDDLPRHQWTPEHKRAYRARRHLTEANLRLVAHFVAKKSFGKSCPKDMLEDYFQAAAVGVWVAAGKFDPTKGYKFSTYATFWMNYECQKLYDQMNHCIRPPTTIAGKVRRIDRAIEELRIKTGEMPSAEELGNFIKLKPSELSLALSRKQRVLSYNDYGGDEQFFKVSSDIYGQEKGLLDWIRIDEAQ